MNANELLKLMNRTPFEPFEIRLSDGGRVIVEHPWEISTRPESAVCVVFVADEGMRIIAFRNITEVVTTVAA
jgi:hypothetical protein